MANRLSPTGLYSLRSVAPRAGFAGSAFGDDPFRGRAAANRATAAEGLLDERLILAIHEPGLVFSASEHLDGVRPLECDVSNLQGVVSIDEVSPRPTKDVEVQQYRQRSAPNWLFFVSEA